MEIRSQALNENLRRAKILAIITICFEVIFASIDVSALILDVHASFHYIVYLAMYGLMILANLLLLLVSIHFHRDKLLAQKPERLENFILIYTIFNMTWGSIVTLLDQRLYGQLTVFMVNVILCSVVFIQDFRRMLIPYLISAVILLGGLPFFQNASDVLIGHYVNLAVFISIAWMASRLLYHSYCSNLLNKLALERSNQLLAEESTTNQMINEKLNQANLQLRQLSLIDELTGIANRRGLRNFISQVYEKYDIKIESLAAAMIDIDNFKIYNDTYGHPAGDKVLAAIAAVLDESIQSSSELAARWGGEEFIMLSFNADPDDFAAKSEMIRQKVEELGIINESAHPGGLVTVSIGISHKPAADQADVGRIISDADVAMYMAKQAGRNRVSSL